MPSRLLIGTARYPSPQVMSQSVKASRAAIVTVSLRREMARAGNGGQRFFDLIKELGVRVLPNTAGCRTPKEAIATAQMARELFGTDWIKLEVIGNDDTLQPDLFGLVEAAAAPQQGRLQGLPLHHRGLDRRRAPDGGRLRGADALGCADRHGPRPRQPLRAANPARVFPGRAARHRRRHRRAVARGRGHGDGLRRRAAEHCDCHRRRSRAHGARLRRCHRRGPHSPSRPA